MKTEPSKSYELKTVVYYFICCLIWMVNRLFVDVFIIVFSSIIFLVQKDNIPALANIFIGLYCFAKNADLMMSIVLEKESQQKKIDWILGYIGWINLSVFALTIIFWIYK